MSSLGIVLHRCAASRGCGTQTSRASREAFVQEDLRSKFWGNEIVRRPPSKFSSSSSLL